MLPTQETANLKDPKQHFTWALRNMPMVAGFGAVTNPAILIGWSEHLWQCGFAHRDYLESLADADGNIHVSKLPKQVKKFQKPMRGPFHGYNNAARWVSPETPDPKPMRIPDVRKYTIQEQHALRDLLIETGVVRESGPQPALAEVYE